MAASIPNLRLLDRSAAAGKVDLVSELFQQISRLIPLEQSSLTIRPRIMLSGCWGGGGLTVERLMVEKTRLPTLLSTIRPPDYNAIGFSGSLIKGDRCFLRHTSRIFHCSATLVTIRARPPLTSTT